MPVEHPQQTIDHPAIWPMYRALVGVGTVCGLLIVTVFVLTLPVIERNQAEALQRAVLQVLPGAVSKESFTLDQDGVFRTVQAGDAPAQMVHAGYDAQGVLVGVAVQGEGMGYQDVIRILYGYSPASQVIVGIQVLASKETPGLGDKIEKDPVFLQNFAALDVALGADAAALANPIQAVKRGEKVHPWQVDTITGATISSKAIANILAQASHYWVPRIHPQRQLFEEAGATDDRL